MFLYEGNGTELMQKTEVSPSYLCKTKIEDGNHL